MKRTSLVAAILSALCAAATGARPAHAADDKQIAKLIKQLKDKKDGGQVGYGAPQLNPGSTDVEA